jgi:hypothetical protein
MILVAPADPSRSRTFRIVDGESERGARLGGRAPDGVGDSVLREDAVYVMTVPLSSTPELELSIFVQGEIWAAMNQGLFSDVRVVALPHVPSHRRSDGRFRSQLSEHRIVLGDEISDADPESDDADGPKPWSHHKIGGRPYCIQEPELEGAEALSQRGFVQLIQLDFPGSADGAVSGSWPFADGMFNLFGKPPFDEFFWAFQK